MSPTEFSARQRAAERVARDAGALARSYLADLAALNVTLKGPQDVVTTADSAVERMIVADLRAEFPDDSFLGEEGGGAAGDRCWVIDPIVGQRDHCRDTGALFGNCRGA